VARRQSTSDLGFITSMQMIRLPEFDVTQHHHHHHHRALLSSIRSIQSPTTLRLLLNPLERRGKIAPHRTIWSWYTGRLWVGCYSWYSEEGTGRRHSPPRHCIVYNGPLLCGVDVLIKR